MRKLVLTIALASVAALALASCGGSSSSSSSTPASTPSSGGGGGGGTASGGGSTVNIAADPSGALKYTTSSASAKAGNVTIDFTNQSPIAHNVTVADSSGKVLGATSTGTGTASASVNLKPGTYTFYCSVDSHEQAGMKGTLTVK